jgi:hypothetical protein
MRSGSSRHHVHSTGRLEVPVAKTARSANIPSRPRCGGGRRPNMREPRDMTCAFVERDRLRWVQLTRPPVGPHRGPHDGDRRFGTEPGVESGGRLVLRPTTTARGAGG